MKMVCKNECLSIITYLIFSQQGFFSMGSFSLGSFHPARNLFHGKYLFCIHSHYIIYCMDSAQLLHVVVKQASKLYLDILGHKPKDRLSLHVAHIAIFTVQLPVLGPPASSVS